MVDPGISDPVETLVLGKSEEKRDFARRSGFPRSICGCVEQAEVEVLAMELIKVGMNGETFYRWKKKYVGPEMDQVRQPIEAVGGRN